MSLVISDSYFHELAGDCEDRDLDAVWRWLKPDCIDFEETREAFFIVLRRLLQEKHIRIQDFQTHQPLTGTIDEQVDQFRNTFPKNEAEMEDGFWFFDANCPGGCNWKWKC